MRVCGLKRELIDMYYCEEFTPHAGVWIETSSNFAWYSVSASHPETSNVRRLIA